MSQPSPIFLFTDFGWSGPYAGQMTAAILDCAPAATVINLMHDAPAMRPDLAAYLLAACCHALPNGSVVVAVVDPGVGGERAALVVETADMLFIGPDNGLLSRLQGIRRVQRVDWRPEVLSASFHGRDLFAPVAVRLAYGEPLSASRISQQQMVGADWPVDLDRVVFVDAYGNLMTGMRAEKFNENREIQVSGRIVPHARTFCDVAPGELFWYCNSQGLVEIAANGVSAQASLSLALGDKILLD